MNVIFCVIAVASVVVLIYALLMRSSRGANSEALQGGVQQHSEDENRRLADADGNSWLMQQSESDRTSKEHVTPTVTTTADRSRCPACGASITANDERCPSCEICFVTDGSPKWTLGTVGPADGIYLRSTEISE
jgi:hypothetical protein